MDLTAESGTPEDLFARMRVFFGLLAGSALVTGYLGIWQYVHTERGAGYGRAPWDIAYYDLQLFVLGAKPLEGPPPFNPALEIARYLAAATTVYAVVLAASALFGDSWRRWRRRRTKRHAIVVGTTTEARAILARRAKTMKVLAVDNGDIESLRAAGIAGANVVYACGADREDVAANVATALAASSLRRGRDLRINVHVTDPTLALGLKARRLMMDDGDEPVVEFFSMDEMAARRYVESDVFEEPVQPRILVAGAGAFGQAIVVEFARRWRERSSSLVERLSVTLVDDHAQIAADQLTDRWPVVGDMCDITVVAEPMQRLLLRGAVQTPYRAFFSYEDEHLALSTALSAVALWRGGRRSIVVRLNRLARHGAAFDGDQGLLDDLDGRLSVVNVADVAGELVVQDREPVGDLAEAVHARYIAARLATAELPMAIHESHIATALAAGTEMESTLALRPWTELSEDLRHANRAQARDFTTKLKRIGCTIAPRSTHLSAFELRDDELEELAVHEHGRWMRERMTQGWRYGPERDNKRKLHPDLVPWDQLHVTSKDKDRDTVRNIPTIYEAALADVGLQIVRLTP